MCHPLIWDGTVVTKQVLWNLWRKPTGITRKGILLVTRQQISILLTVNMLCSIIINRLERPETLHSKIFTSIHPCYTLTNESLEEEDLTAHKNIISSSLALTVKSNEIIMEFLGIVLIPWQTYCFLPFYYLFWL